MTASEGWPYNNGPEQGQHETYGSLLANMIMPVNPRPTLILPTWVRIVQGQLGKAEESINMSPSFA